MTVSFIRIKGQKASNKIMSAFFFCRSVQIKKKFKNAIAMEERHNWPAIFRGPNEGQLKQN